MALKYILLIGIGGSSNGARAVYEALHEEGQPEILFAETVSDRINGEIERKLATLGSADELLIVVISRSGTTMETTTNFEYFYEFLTKKFGSIDQRIAVITPERSKVWQEAGEHGWKQHGISPEVSGRYSVFTLVGLVPLGEARIDIEQLSAGSKAGEQGSAEEIFKYCQQGFQTHNFFVFNPELEGVGKWWRQLVAESLGKDGKGILPIVSIGTNDLHSTLQLYLDGPKNIYTTFVSAKPLPKIVHAILEGVKISYTHHGLPFRHIELPELNAYHLGVFMQTQMNEVVVLAKLMGVDPYNQPAVEEYKAEARRLLSSH